jgi:AcrR family transcriptional regulator
MARPHDPRAKIELLRAAEATFVEHGLDRARVEDITARAGRSKGSFYLHFESKEEAFQQIVETLLAQIAGCVDEPPPGDTLTVREVLQVQRERTIEVFEFLWSRRALMGMLLSGAGAAGQAHLIDELAEQMCQAIRRWLVWGQPLGLYRRDLDHELISLAMSGAYDRLARFVVHQAKKPDITALVDQMMRFEAHAIGTSLYIEMVDRLVNNTAKDTP